MERQEVMGEIRGSLLPVARACQAAGIGRASYYRWRHKGTEAKKRGGSWNSLSWEERRAILEVSEDHPEWSSRQIGFYLMDLGLFSVSESTVYRLLKRAGRIPIRPQERRCAGREYLEKPRSVHEQWQVAYAP